MEAPNMTIEEQKILVCEKLLGIVPHSHYCPHCRECKEPTETGHCPHCGEKLHKDLPLLTLDLMWECEEKLDPIIPENVNVYSDTWEKYATKLEEICEHDDPKICPHHATAEQRLAALVETIGGVK